MLLIDFYWPPHRTRILALSPFRTSFPEPPMPQKSSLKSWEAVRSMEFFVSVQIVHPKSQRSEVASDPVMNRVDRIVAVVGVSNWTVSQAACVEI